MGGPPLSSPAVLTQGASSPKSWRQRGPVNPGPRTRLDVCQHLPGPPTGPGPVLGSPWLAGLGPWEKPPGGGWPGSLAERAERAEQAGGGERPSVRELAAGLRSPAARPFSQHKTRRTRNYSKASLAPARRGRAAEGFLKIYVFKANIIANDCSVIWINCFGFFWK